MNAPRRVVETRDVSDPDQKAKALTLALAREAVRLAGGEWQHISDKPLDEYVGKRKDDTER